MSRWLLAVLGAVVLAAGGCTGAVTARGQDALPPAGPGAAGADDLYALAVRDPVATGLTVGGVTKLCHENLEIARRLLETIKQQSPQDPATLTFDSTLGALDDAFLAIFNASELPYLMGVAHPDQAVRQAAKECEAETDELTTAIWLDPDLARVVEAYRGKAEKQSPERAHFLAHTVRSLRRNGAELAPAAKQRLRELNRELTKLGQEFVTAINSAVEAIRVPPESLAGLPAAYVAAHPPDGDGLITITTDYTDYYDFVTYSRDRDAALELYKRFVNRGDIANLRKLDSILALRHEKASLLGYASWADYAIEPRMAGSAAAALGFLQEVDRAIRDAVDRELREFRDEHRRQLKQAPAKLYPPDRYFLEDQLRNRRYALDSRELASYFEVGRVTEGLLAITAEMYQLEYRPITTAVWHPSVLAYDVFDRPSAERLGRLYLDLLPRPQKFKHAAMFQIRTSKRLRNGLRQLPMAALVCNFASPGEPMPHPQVVTYFHELGHVLHHLLTRTELASFAGTNTVRDFVEIPSQVFEEWAWSREVLNRFARQSDTGEPIPPELFDRLTKARRVGLALSTQRQLFLALLDLGYHTRKPPFDTTAELRRIQDEHFAFSYVPGTHFQSSFSHLVGYDAGYYSYQWAQALAHDVLAEFSKEGLLNPRIARRWLDKVLARGGSVPERSLLRDFLGREPSRAAYHRFLRGESQ